MASNQVNGPRSWELRWPQGSYPEAQKTHKDKWFHCRSHAIAWKQLSTNGNFSYRQLCASAIFVFISRPFWKLFVYLLKILAVEKVKFYSQGKQWELENKMRNISSLISHFSFPTKPLFTPWKEQFHLICYLQLIKIRLLFQTFSWKCVLKIISWPERCWI